MIDTPRQRCPGTPSRTLMTLLGAIMLTAFPVDASAASAASADLPAAASGAHAGPMTTAVARQLLKRPPGSLSLGGTSSGRIINARQLKLKGRHYGFFPHIQERGTQWGTDEMAAFIRRVAARVADEHRRTQLRLGNISLRHGGRSPWHASHQVGRDVDIAFFVNDLDGKPVVLNDFVVIGRSGRSRDGSLVFDERRNLTLVLSLLADEQAPVQWIFIARWLERRLMERARKAGVDDEMMRRMAEVLRQPGDSAPHHDHYHVRIFCSLEDRKYGCLNREPWRDWVDMQDADWEAHVHRVGEVLDLPDPALRLRAVRLIERMRAVPAVPRLLDTLGDSESRVRQAALRAIEIIGDPSAAEGLLAWLRKAADPRWALSLFEVYETLDDVGLAAIARRLIDRPQALLHRTVARRHVAPLHIISADILAERGRKPAVPPLLKLLSSSSPRVRRAAHNALGFVTNQRVRGNPSSRSARRHKRVARSWRHFWRHNRSRSWLYWARKGFRSHGIRLRGNTWTHRDVPRLIRTIRHRNRAVSRNARRVLTALTGHDYSPRYRNRAREIRRLHRHWRWWYKRHKRTLRFRRR